MDGGRDFTSNDPRPAMGPAEVMALIRAHAERGFVATPLKSAEGAAPRGVFGGNGLAGLVRDRVDPAAAVATADQPLAMPIPAQAPAFDPSALIAAARAEAFAEGRAAGMAEAREEAFAAGRAEGMVDGMAVGRHDAEVEMQAGLADARAAFMAAARRLDAPTGEEIAGLTASLDLAVRQLAAQRAGIAIDSHPAAFIARVEALADRVGQGLRALELRLNPADLDAIRPHLGASETLCDARLKADPRLSRGDVDIKADDIRLSDLIAPVDMARGKTA